MARIVLARRSACAAALQRLCYGPGALLAVALVAGCASTRTATLIPTKVSSDDVAERVLIPAGLDVNPTQAVVQPKAPIQTSADPPSAVPAVEPTTFALAEAIAFALENNPRLRSAEAAIERARGRGQAAFAPFLPQVDLLGQFGVVSKNLAPGVPGYTGLVLAGDFGTRSYAETELGLQWLLHDFGRTGGRYRQAVARERIAELQLTRARQTVEFEVAAAYLDVLLSRATRRVQVDAVRRAKAFLDDAVARREGGAALKENVLRAEVQLSESREALVLAREAEFNAQARLNNAMGRNAGVPLRVVDVEAEPPQPGALADLLEQAAQQRPEVGLAGRAVEAAQSGLEATRGEFCPRIFVRASAGRTDGENVATGWQEGAGLHVELPLYSGGKRNGELRSANAEVSAALADARTILDAVSLQVNVAFRGVAASQERIELARTAIDQAEENLRLLRVRYLNGNATPTDIVDGEAALTRSQQRFYSATYTYLAALARLDYALGSPQGALLRQTGDENPESQPAPEQLIVPARLEVLQTSGRQQARPAKDTELPIILPMRNAEGW